MVSHGIKLYKLFHKNFKTSQADILLKTYIFETKNSREAFYFTELVTPALVQNAYTTNLNINLSNGS